jgi:hypothetical protein
LLKEEAMSDRAAHPTAAVVVSLACLAGVASGACSNTPPASQPTAAPKTVVVQGTLQEGYTGRPINTGEVVLAGYQQGMKLKIATSTTPDAGGRFRFERVERDVSLSPPDFLMLSWKPDDASKTRLLRVEPHRLAEDHLQRAQDVPFDGTAVSVDLGKRGGTIDLGTASVWLDAVAQEVFGPACREGRPVASVPAATNVVVFWQDAANPQSSVSGRWHKEIASMWPAGWKGVACVSATEEKAFTYAKNYGFGPAVTGAYRVNWDVLVVRLPEGQAMRKTLSAAPPQFIEVDDSKPVKDGKGNPLPLLREWLASLPR